MKLFGKKDGHAAAPEELAADDLGEMDATFEEVEGAPAAPAKSLSAPSRSLSGGAGGGRKNLMILVLLVVVAGLAGGYFWIMGETDVQPIHVTATVTDTNPAIPPQPAVDGLPAPAPDALAAATPPQPGVATTANPADPFATPPAGGATPADPMAASADPLATPADPTAAPTDPMSPPADPMAASANVAADPAASQPATTDPAAAAAILGLPPGEDATLVATVPGTAPVAGGPDDLAPDMPAAMEAPATPDGMPPQAAATMPADPATVSETGETAPSWAAPGTAAIPGTTNPAANGTSPNEAELAIVQHADVIDQLSRPASGAAATTAVVTPGAATGAPFDPATTKVLNANSMKTVGEILEQPGIVRQLPSGYMTIRKESNGGNIDSRLSSARSALAQGNNAAALELFEALHQDYPKDKRILMGRAVSLHKLGQKEEALAAYEAVLNRDPKNLDALNNMLGLLKAKDPQLAVEKLQELRDAYPYQGDITAQLGIAYATTGQYDQALRYLDLAEGLKPGSAFVLYNKSVLLDKMGRSREAASLYRQILRMAADGEMDQSLPLDTIRRRLAVMQ